MTTTSSIKIRSREWAQERKKKSRGKEEDSPVAREWHNTVARQGLCGCYDTSTGKKPTLASITGTGSTTALPPVPEHHQELAGDRRRTNLVGHRYRNPSFG